MSNGSQFLVSMKFVGVDQLSPTTRKMIDDMKNVKQSAQNMFNGMKSPKMFEDMSRALKTLSSQIDEIQKKMDKMKSDGLHNILSGGAALATMAKPIQQAGEIQMQGIQIGGAYGLDQTSEQLARIKDQAKELSSKTLFSQKEIMGISLELAHAQVSKEALKSVLPESTFLAETEILSGKSSSAERSAYNFARMAEDARITSDPKKMASFADSMYRIVNVTHASSEGLGETFKYAMPVVKNLGWDENDMLKASALAAVNGMEGSMAGTHIKDFAERINPYKFLGTKGGDKQLSAMDEAGLLKGVNYDDKGKVVGFESAALLKNKDSLKSYTEMVDVLTEKHKEFIIAGKSELEWAATMNHIFGEQGQDFAIITSHKEAYEKLMKSINSQKGLHEQIDTIREAYKGQAHILHSQIENLSTSIGNHLIPEVTQFISSISPGVTAATKWVDAHRDEVVMAGKITAAFGVFLLTLGAAKLAFGTIGTLITGPLSTGVKTLADVLEKMGAKSAADMLKKSLPDKAIQANIVNIYGKSINDLSGGSSTVGGGGSAGGGKSGKGKSVTVESELPPRSTTHGGGSSKGWGEVTSWGKGALKRGGAIAIPATIAVGAWDVMSAPEGQKIETAAKTSGTAIGGWAGAEAGVAMGAAIGSIVPGIGTAIGAALGGIIGGIAGSYLGDSLTSAAIDSIKKSKANAERILFDKEFSDKENYPALNVLPKLDTSKYSDKEKSSQKSATNYYDTSTHNYSIQADNPKQLFDQIKDSEKTFSNISKKDVLNGYAGD